MRLGFFSSDLINQLTQKKNIWIHAVSVGEVLAVVKLINCITERFPEYNIILSTVTKTGNDVAKAKLNEKGVVIYSPLDFSWVVRKYIRFINPVIYVAAETEIWPNLFFFMHKNSIPIIQVNGRISDETYMKYMKVSFLLRRVLGYVNIFCMQSHLDAERVMTLGASPDNVKVTGNIKFEDFSETKVCDYKRLGFSDKDCVWIAGSTHPGEEEIIINIFVKLKKDFPALRLLLAPRHIERAEEVKRIIKEKNLVSQCFSEIIKPLESLDNHGKRLSEEIGQNKKNPNDCVIVVDTIGHLRSLYNIGDIVFIGKSLTAKGGQNIIEPAFFGKAIVIGPNLQNFKSILKLFQEDNAIIQVKNEGQLQEEMRELLKMPEKIREIGKRAKGVIQKHSGAVEKTLDVISDFLGSSN